MANTDDPRTGPVNVPDRELLTDTRMLNWLAEKTQDHDVMIFRKEFRGRLMTVLTIGHGSAVQLTLRGCIAYMMAHEDTEIGDG